MDKFEKAASIDLRYDTAKGQLSFVELYKLPLASNRVNTVTLDGILVDLYKKLNTEATRTSFITQQRVENYTQLRFDIAKHILDVRLEEQDKVQKRAELKAKKHRILELIKDKQDGALAEKSVEDLEKIYAEIEEDLDK